MAKALGRYNYVWLKDVWLPSCSLAEPTRKDRNWYQAVIAMKKDSEVDMRNFTALKDGCAEVSAGCWPDGGDVHEPWWDEETRPPRPDGGKWSRIIGSYAVRARTRVDPGKIGNGLAIFRRSVGESADADVLDRRDPETMAWLSYRLRPECRVPEIKIGLRGWESEGGARFINAYLNHVVVD